MDISEIVGKLARERVVEKMLDKITDGKAPDPTAIQDLAQDVYLSLLQNDKFKSVYDEGHANFYIARILMNNIVSSSSPYYHTYLKPRIMSCEIDEKILNGGTT